MTCRSDECPVCGMRGCASGNKSRQCVRGLAIAYTKKIREAVADGVMPEWRGEMWIRYMAPLDYAVVDEVGRELRRLMPDSEPEAWEIYSKMSQEDLERVCRTGK